MFQFVGGRIHVWHGVHVRHRLLEYMDPRSRDVDPARLSSIHAKCLAPHRLASSSDVRHANALRFADIGWNPVFPEAQ